MITRKQAEGLLVGRKIVDVRKATVNRYSWLSQKGVVVLLDDGSELELIPNNGCGGCGSGWYALEKLAKSGELPDNIITKVTIVDKDYEKGYERRTRYKLFVFADNQKVNLATFDGSDGNGYYGTGFDIEVRGQREWEN